MKKKKIISFVLYVLGVLFLGLGISTLIVFSVDEEKVDVDNMNLEKAVDSDTLSKSYAQIDKNELKPVFLILCKRLLIILSIMKLVLRVN